MILIAAFIPFIVLIFLGVFARRPLWISGLVAFTLAVPLWIFGVGEDAANLVRPFFRALLISTEIALILLGAITFLEFLKTAGRTQLIKKSLSSLIGEDPRIQALVLAWFFCAFLEGAAGFGAPAAVVAPLMLSLGFNPLVAATLPLIGDSAAVAFGAVGTPIRLGFQGLHLNFTAQIAAGINMIAGAVAPLAILIVTVFATSSEGMRWKKIREMLALASWAGLCFTFPALIVSNVGPEFPTLIGAMVGLFIFILTLRWRFFVPDSIPLGDIKTRGTEGLKQFASAFSPYILVSALLLLGKLLLNRFEIPIAIFNVDLSLRIFQPGLVFLLTALSLKAFNRHFRQASFRQPLFVAARRIPPVWLAIACMAALSQFIVDFSIRGDFSLPFGGGKDEAWVLIFLAPVAGALGSFAAGSATVSNLLFGATLFKLAQFFDVYPGLILALQVVGAGAGNMVSLQNIAAVQVTVGLKNKEREMLRQLWIPCVLYIIIAILVGLALQRFAFGALHNI